MRKCSLLTSCAVLLATLGLQAAEPGPDVVQYQRDSLMSQPIYFRIGNTAIDPAYQDNGEALTQLGSMLTDTTILIRLDSVRITATASPDGSTAYNRQLAMRRAEAVKSYIVQHYPRISPGAIHTYGMVESWQLMRPMLTEGTPYRAQIAAVLDLKLPTPATEARLKTIDGGRAWNYIRTQYLPLMRSGATCAIYTNRMVIPGPEIPEPEPAPVPEVVVVPVPVPVPVVEQIVVVEPQPQPRPLFALKTNLLYDALTALNIEIEVPIGPRWSIAGEYIFPWWLSNSKQRCLQSLSGYLEGRYWFGDRTERRQLTGWFMGLYTGGGNYDVEWNDKGYQGEFCVPVGLSAGYAHVIGRNLSMEYSIGVGYMRTNYRRYHPQTCADGELRLVREMKGTYNWVGPTKIKVSLVWLINGKKR